ncbi:MAG: hypothetical protein R3208_15150, partial [Ketobacteraceae bacterium]|nr:hypothetical protein [Ketobacteraceae bacterium]
MKMHEQIGFKFNALAVICVTLILAGFGWYNYSATSQALQERMDARISLLMDRLQLSLPITLWNYETEQMEKILESEVQADYVGG